MKSTVGHNASSAVSFDTGTICLYCLQKLLLDGYLVIQLFHLADPRVICNTI